MTLPPLRRLYSGILDHAEAILPHWSVIELERSIIELQWSRVEIRGQMATLPSGNLHYYASQQQDGEVPVLFLHGFAFNAPDTWKNQIVALAEEHPILAPDLYWFGDSTPSAPMDTAAAQAAGMVELLDHLGLSRVHVVGVSFGGFVALEMALHHPERVEKLALLDPAGLKPLPLEQSVISAAFPYAQGDLSGLLIPQNVEQLRVFLDRVFYRPPRIPLFALHEILEQEFWKNREAKVRMCRQMMGGGLHDQEDLTGIKRPTLILWGLHDLLLLPTMAERMAAAIPGARQVYLEHSGHSTMLEQPQDVNRELLGFL